MKRSTAILLADAALLILIVILSGCKASSFYPVLGATGGATVGSLGGPAGAAGGSVVGYGIGKGAQLIDQNKDLANTVDALTHGDVSALVDQGLEKHKSGFEEFTSYVKRILIIAACILAIYLSIPIFVARKTAETCSKTAAERHMTKPPFPTNEKS